MTRLVNRLSLAVALFGCGVLAGLKLTLMAL